MTRTIAVCHWPDGVTSQTPHCTEAELADQAAIVQACGGKVVYLVRVRPRWGRRAPPFTWPDDTPIADLPLRTMVKNSLTFYGEYRTAGELRPLLRLKPNQQGHLLRLPNMGKLGLKEVTAVLIDRSDHADANLLKSPVAPSHET